MRKLRKACLFSGKGRPLNSKKMKLTLLFSFLFITTSWANLYSQTTGINLSLKNATIKEAIQEIEAETGFLFIYQDELLDNKKRVSIEVEDESLVSILEQFEEQTATKAQVTEHQIVLQKSDSVSGNESNGKQEQKSVTGVVFNQEGESIPGVTVIVKGTTIGTVTDLDGNFKIDVPANSDMLVLSFVGMKTQEVSVAGKMVVEVVMLEETTGLDEVIIVGYGSQKKVNLTGSVASIDAEEMVARPVTNISSGLSGMAAGVQVIQNNGATAGSDGATIRIRGIGTMNDSNPLVVVDGVPSEGTGIMNDIDPNDIANISILKDAASASIYGSRGANGVILITTKRGQSGKPRVTYNAYYGMQKIPRLVEYVSNSADYMVLANRIRGTEIFPASEIQAWRDNPNDPLMYPNVNWNEEVFGGTSPIMNHSLGYSGGDEKTQYRFSLNYLDQDGIISGNQLQRLGVRTNLSSEVLDGFKLGGNMFFRWSDLTPNGVGYSIEASPVITTLQHPDGRWGGSQSSAVTSGEAPYADLANQVNERTDRRLMGDIFAEWEIISGLKATAKVALDYGQGISNQFNKRYDVWNFRTETIVDSKELATNRSASSRQNQNYQINTNLLLEYTKSFNNHNIKVMGGYETLQFRSDVLSVNKRNFPNNAVTGLDAGLELSGSSNPVAEWTMQSYFGRIMYNFKDKYMLEGNFRADGSSRFKDGNRWGYFPSFSAAWNISEEAFMSDIEAIDLLKIRASWGQLGNNRIGNYAYHSTYALNQNYSFNGQVYSGIAQTSLTNEEIKWEETTTTNIGVDATLLDGKLTFTTEYYIRQTEGILTELPIPEFLGAKTAPTVNLASMENKGFEFTAGYRGSVGDIKYNVSANLSTIDNKVTEYFGDIKTGPIQEGYAYNSFYGYESLGIFKSQDEINNAPTHRANTVPGDLRMKDQITEDTDGDGIPDAGNGVIGSEDKVIIGNPIPKYTFGANLGLRYNGFDFSMLLQGLAKRDKNTYSNAILPMNWANKGVIPQRWVDEEWNADSNPGGVLPNMGLNNRDLNTGGVDGSNISDFWVKDVSYLRVKNIQLGYDLTASILKDKKISKLRVYVSADNLFTFTNEEWGFDPESTNNRTFNVRTITVGVNVGF